MHYSDRTRFVSVLLLLFYLLIAPPPPPLDSLPLLVGAYIPDSRGGICDVVDGAPCDSCITNARAASRHDLRNERVRPFRERSAKVNVRVGNCNWSKKTKKLRWGDKGICERLRVSVYCFKCLRALQFCTPGKPSRSRS